MADNEQFLKVNRTMIIQRTRNPVELADELLQKNLITKEMYNKINTKEHKEEKTREIFSFLNSRCHFDCVFDWLTQNECNMMEELERNMETEYGAPQKKKSRGENQDEADKLSIFPDLKITSTFAKLENWISDPDNSRRLIEYLEKKLGTEGLKNLKKELKAKELKCSLCLNVNNVDDIRKNRDIEHFLSEKNGAKFPKLVFGMFFKKRSCVPLVKKAESSGEEDRDRDRDRTAAGSYSSGYGSYNNDSTLDNIITESGITNGFHENEDKKDIMETHTDGQPQPPGTTPKESPGNLEEETLAVTQENSGVMKFEKVDVQNRFETFPSKLQTPENSPASAPNKMQSLGSIDKQTTEAKISAPSTAIAYTSTPRADPSRRNPETNKKPTKRNNVRKSDLTETTLRDWAVKQCAGGEIKNITDQISIINKAEHQVYPFFTAETIRLYKNPDTGESQILFISTEKISSSTMIKVHYLMFVCEVNTAVLLCPGEPDGRLTKFDGDLIRINKCLRFISEVFTSALAVYKEIQKEELESLVCGEVKP